jgi:hypothetical protein
MLGFHIKSIKKIAAGWPLPPFYTLSTKMDDWPTVDCISNVAL